MAVITVNHHQLWPVRVDVFTCNNSKSTQLLSSCPSVHETEETLTTLMSVSCLKKTLDEAQISLCLICQHLGIDWKTSKYQTSDLFSFML